MRKLLTSDEMKEIVKHSCEGYGSQTTLAYTVGCNPSLINTILKGKSKVSPIIARHYGYKK